MLGAEHLMLDIEARQESLTKYLEGWRPYIRAASDTPAGCPGVL
jgi:hypothetical protein